eukprot:2964653-Pleurochrysis_carterae.AAC.4
MRCRASAHSAGPRKAALCLSANKQKNELTQTGEMTRSSDSQIYSNLNARSDLPAGIKQHNEWSQGIFSPVGKRVERRPRGDDEREQRGRVALAYAVALRHANEALGQAGCGGG